MSRSIPDISHALLMTSQEVWSVRFHCLDDWDHLASATSFVRLNELLLMNWRCTNCFDPWEFLSLWWYLVFFVDFDDVLLQLTIYRMFKRVLKCVKTSSTTPKKLSKSVFNCRITRHYIIRLKLSFFSHFRSCLQY